MDVNDKIRAALMDAFQAEYARLDDDDGISGFVVSHQFAGMSALDRQKMIDEALNRASLVPEERRQVLMVAGLTPDEYEAVGARIRVHKIREKGGAVEVVLHGPLSDAQYVREALDHQKGVQTTQPRQVAGAPGILMSFRAKGTTATPLTKERAIRVLKQNPYIEVMSNA
jgi:acid stress-induced BolA-like protein IbaG/YrbA